MGFKSRRQAIVNPRLQRRMILAQTWPAATVILVCTCVLAILASRLSEEAAMLGHELPSLGGVLVAAAGMLLILVGGLLWHALTVSNRVAGPMFAIRRVLQAQRDGDHRARVKLRKGDYLTDMVDDLNSVLDQLEARSPGQQRSTAAVEEAVDQATADEPSELVPAGRDSGFALVELMATAVVFTVIAIALVRLQVSNVKSTSASQDLATATVELQSCIEHALSLGAAGLLGTDSPFVDGMPVAEYDQRQLPGQQILVEFTNHTAGDAPPRVLHVKGTITWRDRNGRPWSLEAVSACSQ